LLAARAEDHAVPGERLARKSHALIQSDALVAG
jgi:hypothetical protein